MGEIQVREVKTGDVMVTNLRHYQNLLQTKEALTRVLNGMESGISSDFLAMDIRQSLHYLGEITGAITTDDLLDNIFRSFVSGSEIPIQKYTTNELSFFRRAGISGLIQPVSFWK